MRIFYKELLIVDKKEKKARKIQFKKGINIVTSDLNSVGKTSLSLMLLYSFGAKVKFSDKWHLDNIFTKLITALANRTYNIVSHLTLRCRSKILNCMVCLIQSWSDQIIHAAIQNGEFFLLTNFNIKNS